MQVNTQIVQIVLNIVVVVIAALTHHEQSQECITRSVHLTHKHRATHIRTVLQSIRIRTNAQLIKFMFCC